MHGDRKFPEPFRLIAVLLVVAALFIHGTVFAAPPAGGAADRRAVDAVSVNAQDGSADATAFLTAERWSPYACGIGIGILCWLIFLFSNRPLGVSTAYAKTAGMLEKIWRGRQVEHMEYYKNNPPGVGWELMLVAGLIIGSCLSALLSGNFEFVFLPETWRTHVGDGLLLRWLTALAGGMIMGIGARWAGGCTSGHGISGALQLAVSSWLVVVSMFVGGILTAYAIM